MKIDKGVSALPDPPAETPGLDPAATPVRPIDSSSASQILE